MLQDKGFCERYKDSKEEFWVVISMLWVWVKDKEGAGDK